MKGNMPNGPKKQWTDVFKRKGFYPALYLCIAAILITVVIAYQQFENKVTKNIEELNDIIDLQDLSKGDPTDDEETEPVVKQAETVQMPVLEMERAEIVTKFFDHDLDATEQTAALKMYNNRYYQSKGIDIRMDDGDVFEVVAALSGTVTEVKEDPLYGFVVTIDHGDDLMTYYASLDAIQVDVGDEVSQGDTLAYAGTSLYGKDLGKHVYFEMRKGEMVINPEKSFNQAVTKLLEEDAEEPEVQGETEEQEEEMEPEQDSPQENQAE